MGLFDGLDLANAPADPWKIADGTHKFIISEAPKVGPTQDGKKNGILFRFEITEGDVGKNKTEWLEIPAVGDASAEAVTRRSFLRQRLESLGVPEAKFDTIEPADFIGTEGYLTVETSKKDADRQFIKKITLEAPAEGTVTPSPEIAAGSGNLFG